MSLLLSSHANHEQTQQQTQSEPTPTSSSSRGRELIRTIPPITFGIISLCSVLYVIQVVCDIPSNLQDVTLCPYCMIMSSSWYTQWYRIITGVLYHGNMMHIGMNMISCYGLGMILEKYYGTVRFMVITLWSILLTSLLYLCIVYVLSILYDASIIHHHAIGYSSILFHYVVIECHIHGNHAATRNVFGVVQVPSYWYPYVLLIITQIILPNISFLGHLSGILIGTCQIRGMILSTTRHSWMIPHETILQHYDNVVLCQRYIAHYFPSYVPTTSIVIDNTTTTTATNTTTMMMMMTRMISYVRDTVRRVIERFNVLIFGRGRQINENIHLFSTSQDDDDHYHHVITATKTSTTSTSSPTLSLV